MMEGSDDDLATWPRNSDSPDQMLKFQNKIHFQQEQIAAQNFVAVLVRMMHAAVQHFRIVLQTILMEII